MFSSSSSFFFRYRPLFSQPQDIKNKIKHIFKYFGMLCVCDVLCVNRSFH